MTEAFSKLGGENLYAEAWAEFEKELAVMVRRDKTAAGRYKSLMGTHALTHAKHPNTRTSASALRERERERLIGTHARTHKPANTRIYARVQALSERERQRAAGRERQRGIDLDWYR